MENRIEVKTKSQNRRDDLILGFLVLNLLFGFVNYYKQIMTQTLLDARAVAQTDNIRVNIKNGSITPEQIEIYRLNWSAAGYDRVAPVEMLDEK